MDSWIWILIAIVALVVLAALLLGGRKARDKRVQQQLEERRTEATGLRDEAQERLREAGEREARAQQEAERARRERAAGEAALQRAEDVDPDSPDWDDSADEPGSRLRRSD